ncbi:ribosome recycling factor [Candidatus Parcubacteria bacterium]|nr:ribosome recycling factor [Candidatus Parcubacteria bacterium]
MNDYIDIKQDNFVRIIEFFEKEIISLRTGRANAAVLDDVLVDSYGAKTQINTLASISVPDGISMLITPWDKNILKDIEKAIVDAKLGLGVVNEGEQLRLTVPKMTEENRKDLVKKLNDMMEETRIKFRKIRDDIKSLIEKDEKDGEITKDDKFDFIKELDEFIKIKNEEIKEIRDKKEKDIMTI